MEHIYLSGFADEICNDFDGQLAAVSSLGMQYICLRSADGKNIAEYTLQEVQTQLLPRLQAAGIGVSSLGSPIGKIKIDDAEAFATQLVQLETLCKVCNLLDCRYIRVFSFYMPEGADPAQYTDAVVAKLGQFVAIAEQYNVVLLHENEKEIYGDVAQRCVLLAERLPSPQFAFAFDFANFVQCGEDPALCWAQMKNRVDYIHIKDALHSDNENVLCGTGEGKIAEILQQAICQEGYTGFLTLEPHLVLFDALQSLETGDATEVIRENKYPDGATGYAAQYHALCEILQSFSTKKENTNE